MKPDKAHRDIDREIERYVTRTRNSYQKLSADLVAFYKKKVASFEEKEKLLEGADAIAYRKRCLVYESRAKARINTLARLVTDFNKQEVQLLNQQGELFYMLGFNAINDRLQNLGLPFSVLDGDMLKVLLEEQPDLLPKAKLKVKADRAWNAKRIQSEFLVGIEKGEDIQKLADRLQTIVDMNFNSAVRNARTIATRVENQGRNDRFEQDKQLYPQYGYRVEKVWIATPDERTRPHHRELNGRIAGRAGIFGYGLRYPCDPKAPPAEIWNCRCSLGTRFVKI